jgi:hypothetical protein
VLLLLVVVLASLPVSPLASLLLLLALAAAVAAPEAAALTASTCHWKFAHMSTSPLVMCSTARAMSPPASPSFAHCRACAYASFLAAAPTAVVEFDGEKLNPSMPAPRTSTRTSTSYFIQN